MPSQDKKAAGEAEVQKAIAAMPENDRVMAGKFHKIVKDNAPDLWPRTWYGMPAYATPNGKVVCFYQSADKFHTRYATIGFMHEARLDDGNMWPASFAVLAITGAEEDRLAELIRQAVNG